MTDTAATPPVRKVGILLGVGIFLLPFIFAWFTLRKGHTQLARVVSFGWLAVMVIGAALQPKTDAPPQPARPALETPAKSAEQLAAEDAERLAKAYEHDPETALTLKSVSGTKEGFETILEINGAIDNAAAFDIKDPEIECALTGPSGTQVGRVNATLYEIIPAHGSKSFSKLSMGFMGSDQVANFACSIKRAARP